MGRVNFEVCHCQVIVYLNLIIYVVGSKTFERTQSLVRSPNSCVRIWDPCPVDPNSETTRLLTLIKKALYKYKFVALSVYNGLLSLQSHRNDLLSRRGTDHWHAEDKNEFKDGLLALRALCLRSFPEFVANLKIGPMARRSETSTKLMNFTVSGEYFISLLRGSLSISFFISDSQIHRKDSLCSDYR